MRVEVPENVFNALQSYRQRWGSLSLVSTDKVVLDLKEAGLTEEADWIEANSDRVIRGSVVGFIIEGTPLPPEQPRGSDLTED